MISDAMTSPYYARATSWPWVLPCIIILLYSGMNMAQQKPFFGHGEGTDARNYQSPLSREESMNMAQQKLHKLPKSTSCTLQKLHKLPKSTSCTLQKLHKLRESTSCTLQKLHKLPKSTSCTNCHSSCVYEDFAGSNLLLSFLMLLSLVLSPNLVKTYHTRSKTSRMSPLIYFDRINFCIVWM
jgi:hypothetical protein